MLAAEEAGDLLDRTHGGGEPDALGVIVEQCVEQLEGQREVGAALGAGDGRRLALQSLLRGVLVLVVLFFFLLLISSLSSLLVKAMMYVGVRRRT